MWQGFRLLGIVSPHGSTCLAQFRARIEALNHRSTPLELCQDLPRCAAKSERAPLRLQGEDDLDQRPPEGCLQRACAEHFDLIELARHCPGDVLP
jgi:hypothetical protein